MSLKVGLIAILPNLFPIIINFGIMGWLGIELSMVTSLIASIAIGNFWGDDDDHVSVSPDRRIDSSAFSDTAHRVSHRVESETVEARQGASNGNSAFQRLVTHPGSLYPHGRIT